MYFWKVFALAAVVIFAYDSYTEAKCKAELRQARSQCVKQQAPQPPQANPTSLTWS